MRMITIHQSEGSIIELFDDSDEPISTYCEKLSQLMKMGNVAILKTSKSSVVLRPSKISSIQVDDENNTRIPVEPVEEILPPEPPTEEQEKVEDIITDVDD
jgi:hypothetical protein